MSNASAEDYLKELTGMGFSRERVREMLAGAGWSGADIEKAFGGTASQAVPGPTPRPADPSPSIPAIEPHTSISEAVARPPSLGRGTFFVRAVLLIVVALVATGGGVAARYFFGGPEKALYDAFSNMRELRLFHVVTNISVGISSPGNPLGGTGETKGSVVSDQYIDVRDPAAVKTKGMLRLNVEPASARASGAQPQFDFSGDLISIGKDVYLRLRLSPATLNFVGAFAGDALSFQNKWIHLSATDYSNLPLSAGMDSNFQDFETRNEQIREAVWRLFVKHRPLTAEFEERGKVTAEEKVDVIRVRFAREQLTPFLTELSAEFGNPFPVEKMEGVANSIATTLENAITIWVGESSRLVKEIHVAFPFPANKMKASGNISVAVAFSDIGKEETVVAPAETISLSEILGSFQLPKPVPFATSSMPQR